MADKDHGLDTLLLLNDKIYDQGNGYWVKIEAWQVESNPRIPTVSATRSHGMIVMEPD